MLAITIAVIAMPHRTVGRIGLEQQVNSLNAALPWQDHPAHAAQSGQAASNRWQAVHRGNFRIIPAVFDQ